MQTEFVAMGIQIAFFLITSLIGYRFYKKEKRGILVTIDEKIQGAIDGVGNSVNEYIEAILEKPIVKASMTNLGQKGGAAMQQKSIVNKMAMDVLDSGKFAGVKLLAKTALNIDLDQYIEENGAVATLQAAQSLGEMVGVDVTQLVAGGGLNGANLSVGAEADNPYLRR